MIFLDIKVISKSCAKITISKQESEQLEISFESFESRNTKAKTFLTYIIAIMSDMNIIHSPDDHISIEVFEQDTQDIIIYISAFPSVDTNRQPCSYYILSTETPDDFFKISAELQGKISDPQLYFYSNLYHLIFKSKMPESKLKSLFRTDRITSTNHIRIAKIKEYGTFLCDTPFEKLI